MTEEIAYRHAFHSLTCSYDSTPCPTYPLTSRSCFKAYGAAAVSHRQWHCL